MKRFIPLIILTAIALSMPASAARKPVDFRRTLFVPVGQETLILEAPLGMCFLDQTSHAEGTLYKTFAGVVDRVGGQVLLAVFAGCDALANLGYKPGPGDDNTPPLNTGTVTWMNPSIGATTTLTRPDYLDMREASFLQYAGNAAAGLFLDENVHRTENNVSLGLSVEKIPQSKMVKKAAVLATTTLRHIPIEVVIHYAREAPMTMEDYYPLMDKFIAQQIALNE